MQRAGKLLQVRQHRLLGGRCEAASLNAQWRRFENQRPGSEGVPYNSEPKKRIQRRRVGLPKVLTSRRCWRDKPVDTDATPPDLHELSGPQALRYRVM
jgi:hypothetical protein